MTLIACLLWVQSNQLWIGHIPPPESPVIMTLFLVNETGEPQEINFDVFTNTGQALSNTTITVPPNETLVTAAEDLFEADASHARFASGPVTLRWSYDLPGLLKQQPLFAPCDGFNQSVSCDWRPVSNGSFGVAVVNTSRETALFTRSDGTQVIDQMYLDPYAKKVIDLSQADVLTIQSDQTFAIVAAQVSNSGSGSSYIPRLLTSEKQARADINDPNLRTLTLHLADTSPRDGRISANEAQQVRTIDAHGLAIRFVTGLARFTELQELNLSDNFIRQITAEALPESLESLSLPANPLTQFPDLASLPMLRQMDLANCSLSHIPFLFHPSLEAIDLTRSGITAIDLSGLPQLKELRLGFNPLDTDQLSLPSQLTHLALNGCQFRSIDLELPELRELDLSHNLLYRVELNTPLLTQLNLAHSQLYELPQLHLKQLSHLTLDDNPIQSLAAVSALTNLVQLNAAGIASTTLTFENEMPLLRYIDFSDGRHAGADLSTCPSLEVAILNGNWFTEVPDFHPDAPLHELNLSSNRISSLTPITTLAHLECLDLSRNQIGAVPSVWRNPVLQRLDLSWNRITRVPGEWVLLGLKSLDLSSNRLDTIDQHFRMDQLEELDLEYNRLTSLAPLDAVELRHLNVSRNMLTLVPAFSYVPALQSLDLVGNRIAGFTDNTQLQQLTHLNLYFNELTDIQPLLILRHLNSLDLSANRLETDQCPHLLEISTYADVLFKHQKGGPLLCPTD